MKWIVWKRPVTSLRRMDQSLFGGLRTGLNLTALVLLMILASSLAIGAPEEKADIPYNSPVNSPATRARCLSSLVPVNRSWDEERDVNINEEFNDYAAIYLDAASPDCKAVGAATLGTKLAGTLGFGERGGTVRTPTGLEVHPFHNWLWGTAVTHIYAAALELRHSGVAVGEDLLEKTRDIFEKTSDTQDPGCAVTVNGCMDDYGLTASGFAWLAAYEAKAGRNAQMYIDRTRQLLAKMFQPMSASGSVCYYVVGSNPVQCDGDPAGLSDGRVQIIGIGHGRENPSYGLGLMTSVASTCLGLYLTGQPCDFDTTDPSSGLTWRQIGIEFLKHARSKTRGYPVTFAPDCVDINRPAGPPVTCADTFGYSPNLFALQRFYVWGLRYRFDDFGPTEFRFDTFDPSYEFRQPEMMYNRRSFWGLNRYVIYYLFASEAWPGGTLNTHFKQIRQSAL